MAIGVLPLTTLCENVLLRNHLQIKDLGSTRYSLIKRVLFKLTSQQLINLENSNPMLILDDDEIWLNLLKREFPENLHERYTTNIYKIIEFFKFELDQLGFDHDQIVFENYIKSKEISLGVKKYKLPYKLLFLKYQQDYIKKEELAIENLRQRMKSIQESKEKNRLIQIDDIIPTNNSRQRQIRNKPERSRLFQKSQDEAKKRRELFKNPINVSPIRRNISTHQINSVISNPKTTNQQKTKTEQSPRVTKPSISTVLSTRVTRSSSPIKTNHIASIFHKPRTKRPTSPMKKEAKR